ASPAVGSSSTSSLFWQPLRLRLRSGVHVGTGASTPATPRSGAAAVAAAGSASNGSLPQAATVAAAGDGGASSSQYEQGLSSFVLAHDQEAPINRGYAPQGMLSRSYSACVVHPSQVAAARTVLASTCSAASGVAATVNGMIRPTHSSTYGFSRPSTAVENTNQARPSSLTMGGNLPASRMLAFAQSLRTAPNTGAGMSGGRTRGSSAGRMALAGAYMAEGGLMPGADVPSSAKRASSICTPVAAGAVHGDSNVGVGGGDINGIHSAHTGGGVSGEGGGGRSVGEIVDKWGGGAAVSSAAPMPLSSVVVATAGEPTAAPPAPALVPTLSAAAMDERVSLSSAEVATPATASAGPAPKVASTLPAPWCPPPLLPVERTGPGSGGSGCNGGSSSDSTRSSSSECWHEVVAVGVVDPVSGRRGVVVMQRDVTAKVVAERHVAQVSETEHRLLEQIFPRHVLQYITEEAGQLGAGRGRVSETDGSGCDDGGSGCDGASSQVSNWRPRIRDCHRLATWHPRVTVLFADIQGFTPMCKVLPPAVVMTFLHTLFTAFDSMLDRHRVYKVETIGDCYMVAGGLIRQDEDGMAAVQGGGHVDPEQALHVVEFAKVCNCHHLAL
ncbi:hypothetical protein Vretifemale_17099, partial [Volvox reticuliferus]